jgi:hypothetical protein
MTIIAHVYNSKEDYNDGTFCNVYTFDTNDLNDYDDFLDLLLMCLKKKKYIVVFSEDIKGAGKNG